MSTPHPSASPAPTEPATAPVLWDGYCADPFVLHAHDGRYVMYGTTPGPRPDGRAFQVLVSQDLQTWQDVGGALTVTGPSTARR